MSHKGRKLGLEASFLDQELGSNQQLELLRMNNRTGERNKSQGAE